MKFAVKITEYLERIVIVNADDFEDAKNNAEMAYNNGQVSLDYRDYKGYDIGFTKIASPGDLERYEEVGVENE